MTNKELQDFLKKFDDDWEVFTPWKSLNITVQAGCDGEIWITPGHKLQRLMYLYQKDARGRIIRTNTTEKPYD